MSDVCDGSVEIGNRRIRDVVGTYSELRVMAELVKLGWRVASYVSSIGKSDLIINDKSGTKLDIQIKTAKTSKDRVKPFIDLRCGGVGRRRIYEDGDFDILVAFEPHTEDFFIWTWDEIKGKVKIRCTEEDKNAWNKIKAPLDT